MPQLLLQLLIAQTHQQAEKSKYLLKILETLSFNHSYSGELIDSAGRQIFWVASLK